MYELEEMKNETWNPKDKCVLIKKRSQTFIERAESVHPIEFYRGEIISCNPITKKYKILLLDAGVYEENVNETALLKWDEFCSKYEYKAKRCHLGGVEPMGDAKGQWSGQAKQYTATTLNGQRVHVVFDWEKKTRDAINDSFEVITN